MKSKVNVPKVFKRLIKDNNNIGHFLLFLMKNFIVESEKDGKRIHSIELNKNAIDLLNVNYMYFKNNYTLNYGHWKVCLTYKHINNDMVLFYGILSVDGIRVFMIFKEDINIKFKQFLYNCLKLNIKTNKVFKYTNKKYNKEQNNKQYFKQREKDKQIILRNKFNKKYHYLTEEERKYLNKKDRKERKFYEDDGMTFIQRMEHKEARIQEIDDELLFIDDMVEYNKLLEEMELLEYDLKQMERILNQDIKNNMFYSNINY